MSGHPLSLSTNPKSLGSENRHGVRGEKLCFHCLEPVPEFVNLTALLDGVSRPMCCTGCKTAADFISERGLMRFYQHRERLGQRDFFAEVATHRLSSLDPNLDKDRWKYLDSPATSDGYVVYTDIGSRDLTIVIDGLYCSSCSWLIERALAGLSDGIQFQADTDMYCVYISITDNHVNISSVLNVIESLGYSPSVNRSGDKTQSKALFKQQKTKALRRIVVAGFGMMQVMTYATASYFGGSAGRTLHAATMPPDMERFFLLVSMLVATIVVFYAGKPFLDNAIKDIRNRHFGMDVTVSLAIVGAYFPSVYSVLIGNQSHVYFDSAVMFVFFLSLGRFVEMRSRHRLSGAVNNVQDLLPFEIEVSRRTANCREMVSIKPTEITKGDQLQLNAGMVIPCDARITAGTIQVDESLVTGESASIVKRLGQTVIAGANVISGEVTVEATGDWLRSSMAKIQQALTSAEKTTLEENRRNQLLGRFFVVFVLCLTLLVSAVWLVLDPSRVFDVSLAMLIASCPCAFALASPVGRSAAINSLRRAGILVTNNRALSKLKSVTTWCFDKTGTLTRGRPSIVNVLCLGDATEKECVKLVAALEAESEHVLSSAFEHIDSPYRASQIQETIGQGISAQIGADQYSVGRRSWVKTQLEGLRLEGGDFAPKSSTFSEVVLIRNGQPLAIIQLQDQLRPSAEKFVDRLIKDNSTVMVLSGDHHSAVQAACEALAIPAYLAELSPDDKSTEIRNLQANGECVAMLGDGINDAPVLAHADVSIAIASGSELALQHSDVVLLNGNLENLNLLLAVANKLNRVTTQNMSWALLYNSLALPLAASGYLTPWIAAIGMSLSSLLVILNASTIQLRTWK